MFVSDALHSMFRENEGKCDDYTEALGALQEAIEGCDQTAFKAVAKENGLAAACRHFAPEQFTAYMGAKMLFYRSLPTEVKDMYVLALELRAGNVDRLAEMFNLHQ